MHAVYRSPYYLLILAMYRSPCYLLIHAVYRSPDCLITHAVYRSLRNAVSVTRGKRRSANTWSC